jgi:dienelactone hydrolase
MKHHAYRIAVAFLLAIALASIIEAQVPRTAEPLWSDFDPRKDPLDVQVVREWEQDGIVYRYVTFQIGTFKGKTARMAAFYAFPKGGTKLPALLHIHGGGQRAFLHEVNFYAKRGYACLTVNWGGREMENAKPGDPNTDWGAVDPTQKNVPGYLNLQPGKLYLDDVESPRNNNWYLLTLGCRRGLTFLEQQAEVDLDKLGVYGHSMGGNLTVFVAGSDNRVKAAAPSVGGSGFRTQPWPLLPQHKPQTPNGDVNLFDATLGFESYAPHIKAPLLWLGATNDFHGIMDDTYRTGELIPHQNVRYSFTPHMNHRFTPEFAVTRPLWFDQYLTGSFSFPETPDSTLVLATDDHVPEMLVTPDSSQAVAEVHVYYSVDPDPRARFWRSAKATKSGTTWSAKLPIMALDQPLFAFANVFYGLKKQEAEPYARSTEHFAISSKLHTVTPQELQSADVMATDKPSLLVDDFSHGWQDWYLLSADNPHHWEYSTRKLADPKWQGRPGQRLFIDVQADKPNELVIVLTENFFRSYRDKSQEFVAVVKLNGGKDTQTVSLEPKDFKTIDGEALSSWKNVDLLSLRAYYEKGDKLIGSKSWVGPQPKFQNLRWVKAEQHRRSTLEGVTPGESGVTTKLPLDPQQLVELGHPLAPPARTRLEMPRVRITPEYAVVLSGSRRGPLGRWSLGLLFGRCSMRSTGLAIVRVIMNSFFVIGDRHNQEVGVQSTPPAVVEPCSPVGVCILG